MEKLTVVCAVLGHKTLFSVEIKNNKPVSELKNKIHATEFQTLSSFQASDLELYRINAFGNNVEERGKALEDEIRRIEDIQKTSSDSALDPLMKLHKVFDGTTPPDNTIHILVVVPSVPSASEKHGRLSEDYADSEPASKRKKRSPRLSDEPQRIEAQIDPRKHTVNGLYQLLCKEGLVQVTGAPGSGKTTLLNLLHQVIREERPNARVFVVRAWPERPLRDLHFEDRWRNRVPNWDGYKNNDFYLIDKGQSSYWDEELWKDFKDEFQKSNTISGPYAILFCSYSKDLREIHSIVPPSLKAARLTLARVTRPPDGGEDMTPVGLLLGWEEYLGVLTRFPDKDLLLDDELKKFIFDFTAGHVGAVNAMFKWVIKMEEAVMTAGKTVTFAEFQRKDPTFQNLTPYLITDSTVSRSLTDSRDYDGTMKRLLLDGPIFYEDQDRALLARAFESGLLELTQSSFYDFPSPLHRQIWSFKLMPVKDYKYPGDILALIKATVAKFRPNQLSRSDRRASTDERDLPEAQYSHEWYRSLHEVTGGNVVISPEYATAPGKRRGRVDFYIPSMKWGLELLRDGDKPREHSDRFLTGAYSALVTSEIIVDYALLDFRHTIPQHKTPEIPKIFYIVFSEENDRARIYDNNLECKWEDNLVHHR